MRHLTIKQPEKGWFSASKQEEKKVIRDLHNYFKDTHAYLEELFNEQLTQWAENKIDEDFPINIFQEYQSTLEES